MANANRYFKYSNEEGALGRGLCYVEFAPVENDWHALRQLETDGEIFLTSNLPTQQVLLCEGRLSSLRPYYPDGPMFEIPQYEFEDEWDRAMRSTTESWHRFKTSHPLRSVLPGTALGFYPQGVLIEIDALFFGLLDYEEYQRRFGNPGRRVQTNIVGYDEKYRWALLELVGE